jgi:hypothetical protein
MAKHHTDHISYVRKIVNDSYTEYHVKVKRKRRPRALRFSLEDGLFYLTVRDRKHWEKCTKIPLRTSDYLTFYGVNPTDESVWVFRSKPSDRVINASLTRGISIGFLNDGVNRIISNN